MAKPKNYENKMNGIFWTWDYHLREKLEAADRITMIMYQEMGHLGVPAEDRSEFIGRKLNEMIEKIASERKVR